MVGLPGLVLVLLLFAGQATSAQPAYEASPGVLLAHFSSVTPEEAADDIRSAESVTDQFWTEHWSDYFTGTYRSPAIYGLYDGRDPASTPVCRTAQGSVRFGPDNAAYCPDVSGPFIAYDASFMARAFREGDSFLYLVVAHEWGHAIADQLNQSLQAQAAELQADCLAGAALYGAVFLLSVATYGFGTWAMLVPAIDVFDVATGRSAAREE